jgi:DNA-binding NarL/FixJ family response regulator
MQPFRLTAASALAHACFYAGRWDEAQAIFQQTLALAEDMGQAWIMGFLHANAALVPAARGEWSTAEQHIARSQLYVSETGSQATAAYADEAATLLAVARDDPSGVVRATERLRQMPESSAQRELAMFSWPAHVIVALSRMGRMDEAKTERAVLSRRARPGEPRTEAARLRAAGELAAACEDLDQARENLGAAVAMAEEPVDALEQAIALDAYGRFLRRRGEHDAAVEHLEQAHHRFQLLVAKPFVERCEQELAACGVQTQDPATRMNPLTPQERVVATHICAGKTNKQVANELVLSVKTIGFHLSNIYAKLGVHSRTQLVAAMSRMDSTVGRSPTGRSGR